MQSFSEESKSTSIKGLSLSAIGELIDRKFLKDRYGHIYAWDPRYINLDVEMLCQKQKELNSKLGNGQSMEANLITIRGTLKLLSRMKILN